MKKVALRHVATVIAGQAPLGNTVHSNDSGIAGIPFIQGNGEFGALHPSPRLVAQRPPRLAERGAILLSVRAPVGAINVADQTIGIGRGLAAITPRAPHDRDFLLWALRAGVAQLRSAATGTTYEAVDGRAIKSMPIPQIPPRRQREIAVFLDRECERIAAATQVAERLETTLIEERRDFFDREVVGATTIELRYLLARIEQGWSPECESCLAEPTGWGVLKVGCVNGGHFRWEEHKKLPDVVAPKPNLEVRAGDLLMSRSNTRELVGSTAVVDDVAARRLILCDLLYRLVPSCATSAGFLALALSSRPGRAQIEAAAGGAAGSMPKISQRIIRSLRVPELRAEEQIAVERRVARRFAKADETTSTISQLRTLLAEYRAALIIEAIAGQLDVAGVSDSQMDERLHEVIEAPPA